MMWKVFGTLVCALFFSACGDEAECKWGDSRPCGAWPCEGEQYCNAETGTWRECSSLDRSCGDCCVCAEIDGEVQPHTTISRYGNGVTDVCDDVDNDCDGATDEDGCECSPLGSTQQCGETDRGECEFGVQICVRQPTSFSAYWSDCIGAVDPTDEVCPPDGLDNNCNGLVDEFSETCNGLDDDCDGYTDETYDCAVGSSASCTTSCNSRGVNTCDSSCNWGTCAPPAEICNGLDDDCDGTSDEGWACTAGVAVRSCTAACGSTGRQVCDSSCNWGTCAPPAETCNGRDDDCDGSSDEDFGCVAGSAGSCTVSCGSTGSRTCSATCSWGTCVSPSETCNNRDDDCDGSIDEDFACRQGSTGSCAASCGSTGSRVCSSSCAWGVCVPPAESCGNGRDDDCDGSVDEGCCTDADHDGHYVRATSCPSSDDCNDSNAAVYPGAVEICDGLDNDCDATTDVIAARTVANITAIHFAGCTVPDGCCDYSGVGVVQSVVLDSSWFTGMARTRVAASVDYAYYASSSPCWNDAEIALNVQTSSANYRLPRVFRCEVQQATCSIMSPWGSFTNTRTFSGGEIPSTVNLEVARDGDYGVKYRNWRVTVEVDCY